MDYSYIYIENIELNQNAISSANNASQFNAGDVRARDAENEFKKFAEQFPIHGELTVKQVEYLAERQAKWAELVTTAYNDILHRRASWVPVTVAGPSKYNSNKMGKLADRELEASGEWHEKMARFLENTGKTLEELTPLDKQLERIRNGNMRYGEVISSDDENAVLKLQAKLENLQESQELMKTVNAYYRTNKTLEGCPGITEKTAAEIQAAMKNSWRTNSKPFESYALQNNNAEIHRTKDRIAELQKRQSMESKEMEINGVKVVENVEANRLQLVFDGKPDKETITLLKSNGFKWAPSVGVWQRQLTDNARYAVKRLLEKIA